MVLSLAAALHSLHTLLHPRARRSYRRGADTFLSEAASFALWVCGLSMQSVEVHHENERTDRGFGQVLSLRLADDYAREVAATSQAFSLQHLGWGARMRYWQVGCRLCGPTDMRDPCALPMSTCPIVTNFKKAARSFT